jgi:chemotaxis protein MotB
VALARAAAEQRRRADLEEAERRRLEAEAQTLEGYRSEFFGALRAVLGDIEGIQIVGDRFLFSSEVLFPSGSADLLPEGRAQIGQVAQILTQVSDRIPEGIDWILRVDGHTDNIPISGGIYADNWELSQARALSVVRYMVNQLNFPPERLAATGFGEYRPVNPASTPQARAQNRRIELKLTER